MPKRNRPREQRKPQKTTNKRWIYIGVVAFAAILISAILIVPGLMGTTNQAAAVATLATRPIPKPDGMAMGEPQAKVVLEEYSDFQCPYCKQFFTDIEPQVVERYVATSLVRFEYHPFSFIGSESKLAAEAAFCAADQNKYWDLQTYIFTAQGAENSGIYTSNSLKAMAKSAGLDTATFGTCLDKGTYKAKVEEANNLAQARGIQSTPAFFVNGKGPLNSNEVITEIENALKSK